MADKFTNKKFWNSEESREFTLKNGIIEILQLNWPQLKFYQGKNGYV
jgi:hypothetical protein